MNINYTAVTQQQQVERHGAGAHKAVTNAISGTGGVVRLTVTGHGFVGSNKIDVTGIIGTTEGNGVGWAIVVVDANTIELTGSVFVHAYVSGGLAVIQ